MRLFIGLYALIVCMALTIAGGSAQAQDSASTLRPLTVAGSEVQDLWRALRSGDAEVFEAIDSRLFTEAIGRPQGQDGLVERWARAWVRGIRSLEDPEPALRVLDQRFQQLRQELPATASERQRMALAIAFLPAPTAQAALVRRAKQLFDRADFQAYLALRALLAEAGNQDLDQPPGHRRSQIALAHLRADPQLPWWSELPSPGPVSLFPADRTWYPQHEAGQQLRWQQEGQILAAYDPAGQLRWQRSLELRTQVWLGNGAALLRGPSGLRLVDEEGGMQLLQMPDDIRVLGISSGAAWFYQDKRVYRRDLYSQEVQRLQLPAPPLAPPLQRGNRSLWLSAHEVFLVEEGALRARYLHGLPAAPGWRLEQGRMHAGQMAGSDRILLRGDDGQRWLLQAFPSNAAPALLPGHLNRAGRHREAIEAWLQLDSEQRRLTSEEWVLALAQSGLPEGWTRDQALQWVEDPPWRLRLLHALLGFDPSDSQERSALIQAADAAPRSLLPQRGLLHHPPSTWSWAISGRSLSEHLQRQPQPSLPESSRQRLSAGAAFVGPAQTLAEAPRVSTLDQQPLSGGGSHRLIDGRYLAVGQDQDQTSLSLHDGDSPESPLLWRHRWPAPGYLPGRSVGLDAPWMLVAEGQARMHVVDPLHGGLKQSLAVPNGLAFPSQTRVMEGGLAILHPIGVGNRITIVKWEGGQSSFTLPQPARWQLPLADQLLIALQDGRLWSEPGSQTLPWPGPLPLTAPSLRADGLVHEDQIWPLLED